MVKDGVARTSSIIFTKESSEHTQTSKNPRFEKYTRRVNLVKINKISKILTKIRIKISKILTKMRIKISTILTKMRIILEKKIMAEPNPERSNRKVNHQTIPAKIRIAPRRIKKRG